MIFEFLQYVEKEVQRLQGKGYGSYSIRSEVRAALPYLPQSDAVVFDVGANKGLWTREMLSVAGARLGKIYCFEPSRHCHDDIAAIVDPRVVLIKKAVSDVEGEQALYFDREGSGIASLAHRLLDHYDTWLDKEETVAVTTLDTVIEQEGIAAVDFVKLDIEGYEFKALQGAERALRCGAIKALAFEFGGTDIDTRTYFRDFWYFLSDLGYRIATINPLGRPHPIARYHEGVENFRTTNFLAWKLPS